MRRPYITGDEAALDLIFLDVSRGNDGIRKTKFIDGSSLPSVSDKDGIELIKMFNSAYERAWVTIPEKFKKRRIHRDGRQAKLFDDDKN